MGRLLRQVVWAAVVVIVVGQSLAQEQTGAHQSQTTPHQDAPAPEPKPELKPLLDELNRLLDDAKYQDALPKADELLQQAQAKGDKIGEAYATRARALALQKLRQNTPEQLPEVASVWATAATLWREIGDEAYQVEALLGQAYCLWRTSPEQAKLLMNEALRKSNESVKRPSAVAIFLNNSGREWSGMGQLEIAEKLSQRALNIQEKLVPNSLPLASTLNQLGLFAWQRGDLNQSTKYYQRSLEICEKLAPTSSEMVTATSGLGLIAWRRGDTASADQFFQRALVIQEKLAPNSLEVARHSSCWHLSLGYKVISRKQRILSSNH